MEPIILALDFDDIGGPDSLLEWLDENPQILRSKLLNLPNSEDVQGFVQVMVCLKGFFPYSVQFFDFFA